eukprot:sb/3478093/
MLILEFPSYSTSILIFVLHHYSSFTFTLYSLVVIVCSRIFISAVRSAFCSFLSDVCLCLCFHLAFCYNVLPKNFLQFPSIVSSVFSCFVFVFFIMSVGSVNSY